VGSKKIKKKLTQENRAVNTSAIEAATGGHPSGIHPNVKIILVLTLALLLMGMLIFLFPENAQFVKYPQLAKMYMGHTLPVERLADVSPLYFYLHLLQQLAAPQAEWALLGLQIAATACSAVLLFLLLEGYCGTPLALVGIAVFLLDRSVIIYTAIFEPEALLLLFLLGFVYSALQPGRRSKMLAGLCLALGLLTRPNLLPLMLLAPVAFRIREGRADWRHSVQLFLVLPLTALLLLSARNASVLGTWSPMVMNPGYVFFEGNNPLSSGQSAVYPPLVSELKNNAEPSKGPDGAHVIYREVATLELGQTPSFSAVNAFWAGKAWAFIADEPLHFASNLLRKGYFFLHAFNRYDLHIAYRYDQLLTKAWIPAIPFSLLAVLALVGVWAVKREWRDYFLPAVVILCQGAMMLTTYISDRQRLMVVPFCVVFAMVGARQLIRWRGPMRLAGMAAVTVLVISLTIPVQRMRDDLYIWQKSKESDRYWREAIFLRGQEQFDQAAQRAAAGFAAAPWFVDNSRPAYLTFGSGDEGFAGRALADRLKQAETETSARFDRAVLLLAAGKLDEARREFLALHEQRAVLNRVYLQSSQPAYYLARIAARNGDPDGARRLAKEALHQAPGDPFVLALLTALTDDTLYQQKLERYFSRADGQFLVGMACLDIGRAACAAVSLHAVSLALPELRRAQIYLAAAHADMAQDKEATAVYNRVSRDRVDPIMLEDKILPAYRRQAESAPAIAWGHIRYAEVLGQYGHPEAAMGEYRQAHLLTGDDKLARSIRQLQRIVDARKATPGLER
jgi:tetratricopeptide (TPR) repeat protein